MRQINGKGIRCWTVLPRARDHVVKCPFAEVPGEHWNFPPMWAWRISILS